MQKGNESCPDSPLTVCTYAGVGQPQGLRARDQSDVSQRCECGRLCGDMCVTCDVCGSCEDTKDGCGCVFLGAFGEYSPVFSLQPHGCSDSFADFIIKG